MEMAFNNSFGLQQPRWIDGDGTAALNLGKPVRGFGHFSWLPDSTGLVFAHAAGVEGINDVPNRVIAVMRMDGTATDLCEGDDPIVLRKIERILYRSKSADGLSRWMTMDLQGSGRRLFSNGLTNFYDAAVSPDESKVFFLKLLKPGESQPFIVGIDGGEPKPVSTAPGYFIEATWR
jgi:hypothetical protein